MLLNQTPFSSSVRLLRGAALAVLTAATLSCEVTSAPEGDRDIAIGGLFSLTGNWATLGVTSKAALELAVADVNAAYAGSGLHFTADVADTKLDPQIALTQATELRARGVQIIIGPQSSAELAVLKPYVDANPVLIVSQSSTAGTLAVAGDNIFRLTPADTLEGVAAAALMYNDGVRSVVPIWRGDAGNRGLHTSTQLEFGLLGGTTSTGIEYAATATNFTAPVSTVSTQVRAAIAQVGANRVGVYLAAFDEVVDVFVAASADPVLSTVRWYGTDGVALSGPILASAAAVAFATKVGYPNPIFGLSDARKDVWGPIAARIQAQAKVEPDAFALGVYDAVWLAAAAYAASPRPATIDQLRARFVAATGSHNGTTGWTVLNAAGDRKFADFDFWSIVKDASGTRWVRTAQYDTQLKVLTR
ncbi:MAG: ABC transporter substrate-binding protein [Gemmatimonadota bacterium]